MAQGQGQRLTLQPFVDYTLLNSTTICVVLDELFIKGLNIELAMLIATKVVCEIPLTIQ